MECVGSLSCNHTVNICKSDVTFYASLKYTYLSPINYADEQGLFRVCSTDPLKVLNLQ